MSFFGGAEFDEMSDEEINRNTSIFEKQPKKSNNRRGSVLPFLRKTGTVDKVVKKKKMLTIRQIDKLNLMEYHQIAANHTFEEIQFIVDSLTKLYAQLYNYRVEIKDFKRQKAGENVVTVVNKGGAPKRSRNGRGPRKGLTLGRRNTTGKRNSRFTSVASQHSTQKNNPGTAHGRPSGVKQRRSSVSRAASKLRSSVHRSGRRGSILRSSVPTFALFASRIKNIKSNPDNDLPIAILVEYNSFKVENALEKADRALIAHKRYKKKERAKWKSWDKMQDKENTESLFKIQRLIPMDLKYMREEEIVEHLKGNTYLAKRFKRHKVFQLFNKSFDEIISIHPVDLQNVYHFGGLDLVELRALYALTKEIRKPWRKQLREKLRSQIEKKDKGTLKPSEIRHPAYENKPNIQNERKPSVIAFMGSRTLPPSNKNAVEGIARELKSRNGLDTIEEEPISKEEEAVNNFYLIKRGPDSPVYSKPPPAVAPSKKKHRRKPQNNIFTAFEEVKANGVNEGGAKNKPVSSDETNIDDIDTVDVVDPGLMSYFTNRDEEEEEDENQNQNDVIAEKPTNKFNFDEDEYAITENDDKKEIRRKKSELLEKAMEIITSDDVHENDEVFLRALRSLSVFTVGDTEDESSDFDDEEASENIYLVSIPPKDAEI